MANAGFGCQHIDYEIVKRMHTCGTSLTNQNPVFHHGRTAPLTWWEEVGGTPGALWAEVDWAAPYLHLVGERGVEVLH